MAFDVLPVAAQTSFRSGRSASVMNAAVAAMIRANFSLREGMCQIALLSRRAMST